MQRRDFIASVGAGLALAPTAGWSQDAYPARPVKLIVPFPPGGPTDIMGRTAAKAMGDALGQSFVVENKAGAGGNIGTDAVAKAAPDGYTIGLSAHQQPGPSRPYLYDKLPFQVEKGLRPDLAGGHHALRDRRAPERTVRRPQGSGGLRQGQPGQARLRPRPASAPANHLAGRAAAVGGRHRTHQHPLQGVEPDRAGPALGHGDHEHGKLAGHHRLPHIRSGQAQGAGRSTSPTRAKPRCRTCPTVGRVPVTPASR